MQKLNGLKKPFKPDWQGLIDNISRKGTPSRVYNIELFQDEEVKNAIAERFALTDDIGRNDSNYERKKYIAVQRFCGFDYVIVNLTDVEFSFERLVTKDIYSNSGVRAYQNEHSGPIKSWADFEKYKWPNSTGPEATCELEWYQEYLPDDMCIIGGLTGHFAERLTELMGYETLCFALFEQRDLVRAIADKLIEHYRKCMERILQFDRVKMIWGSDDMGFKTSLMLPPKELREFVFPGHKMLAEMAHGTGRLYLLHACGKLDKILEDLISDIKIDGKHSFEDTIMDVRDAKRQYGSRIALLGGIDVDFLCRSAEDSIRKRVRETLDVCQPGGGYCLGTGNSVANYIPIRNYLAMLDEGRLYYI